MDTINLTTLSALFWFVSKNFILIDLWLIVSPRYRERK